jgi:hypothetical protein
MPEFGLFSDEGCVEAGFYSRQEADRAAESRYDPDDGLFIEELCPFHAEQPKNGCEECAAEDAET